MDESCGVSRPATSTKHHRSWRSVVFGWVRRSVLVFLLVFVFEYLVVPELVGASKELSLLSRINIFWLIIGIVFEAGSVVSYALLLRTLLFGVPSRMFRMVRIVLVMSALSHVIPGGAAGGASGYQLLTSGGVEGSEAGFAVAAQAIGSAMVLAGLLWFSLLVSIPLAGLHPIYVGAALVGLLVLLVAAGLFYLFTRGEERVVRVVGSIGRRLPHVGEDRLERVARQAAESVAKVAKDKVLLKRAALWGSLYWILDAGSLWSFVAAFGRFADPAELLSAYGIANILAIVPITPGGLGVVEATATALLISFGLTKNVSTLAVLGWRLFNFWMPIPLGVLSYLSLKVPRGSGFRAHRRALTTMGAEARPGDPRPDRPRDGPSAH